MRASREPDCTHITFFSKGVLATGTQTAELSLALVQEIKHQQPAMLYVVVLHTPRPAYSVLLISGTNRQPQAVEPKIISAPESKLERPEPPPPNAQILNAKPNHQ